jgi:hypothetical protein
MMAIMVLDAGCRMPDIEHPESSIQHQHLARKTPELAAGSR